jgi:protein MAK11
MGFSAPSALDFTSAKGELKQEFAFIASEEALTCATALGNLLALGGHEEVVKMFDLKSKRSCGDLSGEHTGSITSVAVTGNHALSASKDGTIMIWRTEDMLPLHTLKVKNVSQVKSLSMHKSQRMCLALYANGMLRLWNLLDARCIFKKKVGLIDEEQSSSDNDEEESE